MAIDSGAQNAVLPPARRPWQGGKTAQILALHEEIPCYPFSLECSQACGVGLTGNNGCPRACTELAEVSRF